MAIDWLSAAVVMTVDVSADAAILRIDGAPVETLSGSQPSSMLTTSLHEIAAQAASTAAVV